MPRLLEAPAAAVEPEVAIVVLTKVDKADFASLTGRNVGELDAGGGRAWYVGGSDLEPLRAVLLYTWPERHVGGRRSDVAHVVHDELPVGVYEEVSGLEHAASRLELEADCIRRGIVELRVVGFSDQSHGLRLTQRPVDCSNRNGLWREHYVRVVGLVAVLDHGVLVGVLQSMAWCGLRMSLLRRLHHYVFKIGRYL